MAESLAHSRATPAVSPDGRNIGYVSPDAPGNEALWIRPLDSSKAEPLAGTEDASHPFWSPDGGRIAFPPDRREGNSDIYVRATDGSGDDVLLFASPDSDSPRDWSPDGKFLTYQRGGDIWLLPVAEPGRSIPPATTEFDETEPAFSPNARWIAYVSNESSGFEVFVRTLPGAPAGRWQVSSGGGEDPVWSRHGKELFYRSPEGDLIAVEIRGSWTLEKGARRALFRIKATTLVRGASTVYDVSADGQEFPVNAPAPESESPLFVVIPWISALRR